MKVWLRGYLRSCWISRYKKYSLRSRSPRDKRALIFYEEVIILFIRIFVSYLFFNLGRGNDEIPTFWVINSILFLSLQSYRNKGGRGGGNSNQSQGPPTPQQTPASGTVTPQPATHPAGGGAILALNGNESSPNPSMMTTTDHSVSGFEVFDGELCEKDSELSTICDFVRFKSG